VVFTHTSEAFPFPLGTRSLVFSRSQRTYSARHGAPSSPSQVSSFFSVSGPFRVFSDSTKAYVTFPGQPPDSCGCDISFVSLYFFDVLPFRRILFVSLHPDFCFVSRRFYRCSLRRMIPGKTLPFPFWTFPAQTFGPAFPGCPRWLRLFSAKLERLSPFSRRIRFSSASWKFFCLKLSGQSVPSSLQCSPDV